MQTTVAKIVITKKKKKREREQTLVSRQSLCLFMQVPSTTATTDYNGSCPKLTNQRQEGKLGVLLFCFHDFQQSFSQKEESRCGR